MSEETAEQLAIRVLTFRFGSKFAKELVDDLKAMGLEMKKIDAVHNSNGALDIALWCEHELNEARTSGSLETRPFVQNARLIVDALKFYSENIGKVTK